MTTYPLGVVVVGYGVADCEGFSIFPSAAWPSNGGAEASFDGSAAPEPPNDHQEGAENAVVPLRHPEATQRIAAQRQDAAKRPLPPVVRCVIECHC